MGLPRPAKAALEQMVGAKGDKLPLLFAAGAGQHPFDGGGQIVLDDDFGDPAQFLKSGHVAGEESFLAFPRESHHKEPLRVAQPEGLCFYELVDQAGSGASAAMAGCSTLVLRLMASRADNTSVADSGRSDGSLANKRRMTASRGRGH